MCIALPDFYDSAKVGDYSLPQARLLHPVHVLGEDILVAATPMLPEQNGCGATLVACFGLTSNCARGLCLLGSMTGRPYWTCKVRARCAERHNAHSELDAHDRWVQHLHKSHMSDVDPAAAPDYYSNRARPSLVVFFSHQPC